MPEMQERFPVHQFTRAKADALLAYPPYGYIGKFSEEFLCLI